MECVNKCEFQVFDDGEFHCSLYDKDLDIQKEPAATRITIKRCDKCVEEGTIGSNSIKEKVKKLKAHIGWLMDFFYSFKDDMEGEVSDIYRLIKEIEKDEQKRV